PVRPAQRVCAQGRRVRPCIAFVSKKGIERINGGLVSRRLTLMQRSGITVASMRELCRVANTSGLQLRRPRHQQPSDEMPRILHADDADYVELKSAHDFL